MPEVFRDERPHSLIIEDDRTSRLLLERSLQKRGQIAIAVASAEEAIRALDAKFYPLILLDIGLPGMNGLDLIRLLRARPDGDAYYILVVTGMDSTQDLKEILDAGASDYIGKPINLALMDVRLAVAEAQVRDIAARKQLEARLRFLAQRDPLTGLLNRSQLEPAIQASIDAAKSGVPSAVLYVDLDNFKIVNDSLGHDAGDRLLIEVSRLLKDSTRADDMLVRFGGDEFVIILAGSPLDSSTRIAERLRSKVEGFVFAESGSSFRLGASVGLAQVESTWTVSEALGAADSACYAAKARGRNRVEIHHESNVEIAKLIADTDWSSRVRDAMRDGTLQIWFQPVLETGKKKIGFQEVLVRYVDPRLQSPVSPNVFMTAIQRSGQGVRLDRFVIRRSIEAIAANPGLKLAVNLCGVSLSESGLCEYVEETLLSSGVDPSSIIFEVTESEVIHNLTHARDIILRLQKLGCRFALDDFGAGFSSLVYLKDLPVDIIKIDGAFTRGLGDGEFNLALLRSIRDIASILGIETVAECVETEQQFQILGDLGIHYMQGHFVATPRETAYRDDEIFLAHRP